MTGHTASVRPADTALMDQLRACHTEICEWTAQRATTPIAADQASALNNALEALIRVHGLLSRVNMIFLQLEVDNG